MTTATTSSLRSVFSRPTWVWLHRWAGLVMALFLIIAALTGSLLAFYDDLDHAISPHLFQVEPRGEPLSPLQLRERAQSLVPDDASVNWVYLDRKPDESAMFFYEGPVIDRDSGKHKEYENNTLFLDPYTGEELGRRYWGAISQGMVNLMPFIYKLHYTLAIPGQVGLWLFGIIAIIWTLDCFVGFYLTLPARRRNGSGNGRSDGESGNGNGNGNGRGFWQRWKPAWKIKWNGSPYRINFDLHRAGGLWLWAMLFVFAWSAVGLNLGNQVYKPVMGLFFEIKDPWQEIPLLEADRYDPEIGWAQALETGRRYMQQESERHGFAIEREDALGYDPHRGMYRYRVHSDRDISSEWGQTQVFFDGNSGERVYTLLPSGQAAGNTVTNWLFALHMAAVFGLPYRIFVCVLGLLVTMLTVTGVVIWWRKRRARLAGRVRTPARAPYPSRQVPALGPLSENLFVNDQRRN